MVVLVGTSCKLFGFDGVDEFVQVPDVVVDVFPLALAILVAKHVDAGKAWHP